MHGQVGEQGLRLCEGGAIILGRHRLSSVGVPHTKADGARGMAAPPLFARASAQILASAAESGCPQSSAGVRCPGIPKRAAVRSRSR